MCSSPARQGSQIEAVGGWRARLRALSGKLVGRRRPRAKLGVLAILKNEGMNLREWVDHYRWQGVEKFFLIDNGSTDRSAALVADEVAAGIVEWFVRPKPHAQVKHYREVFRRARIRPKVEWLVMADLDEFWYAPRSTLREEMDRFDGIDLIYGNWRVFGSCGYREHPESLRRCLTLRHPDLGPHSVTKWICRTDALRTAHQIWIHKVKWIPSQRVVSDNERLHLNHYVTQSLEYYTKVKQVRGDAYRRHSDQVRDMEYFRKYDELATLEDRLLADLCVSAARDRAT